MADPIWVDNTTPVNSVNMTKLQTRDEKGGVNGYAPLDATSKVPAAYLPAAGAGLPADTVVAAATRIIENKLLAGDTQGAWRVKGDGKMEWGPGGTTATDRNLYRSAAGLKTDGRIEAGTYLFANQGTANEVVIGHTGGATAAGMYFGNTADTNLYRSAADTLKTDDTFQSALPVYANAGGGASQVILGHTGVGIGAGIFIGGDVNLYRGAANLLSTDDGITAQGTIYAGVNSGNHIGIGNLGPSAAAAVIFGTAGDTNLYRSAAGVLKTDGVLNAVGGLQVNGVPVGGGADGWSAISATITFSSQDGTTPVFFCTTSADLTTQFGVGARLKLTHAAVTKYFIVVAMTSSSLSLFGGTDYTLASGAITNPSFSLVKAPLGFPLDTQKWTVTMSDNTARTLSGPTAGAWYNIGSLQLVIPIGIWTVSYQVVNYPKGTMTPGNIGQVTTLSTTTTTETDAFLSAYGESSPWASNASAYDITTVYREREIALAAKTTYYLNAKCFSAGASGWLCFDGNTCRTFIRAICVYV